LAKQLFNKYEDYQKEILQNINVNISLGNINVEKVIEMYREVSDIVTNYIILLLS